MSLKRENIVLSLIVLLFSVSLRLTAGKVLSPPPYLNDINLFALPDTTLPFPLELENNYPFSNSNSSPLYLSNPSNIQQEIVYDPESKSFVFQEKIGSWNYRSPQVMSNDEFKQYQFRQAVQDYWKIKAGNSGADEQLSFIPPINLGGEAFDKVFGSNTINIIPTGSAELIFGFNYYINENPNYNEKARRTPSFQFDEKILMNVGGSIGDKMDLDFSYNTEATFDFEQKTKLEYAGEEDEILKKIEGGNVTLPLPGTLINGSMSLFGIKTEMQFGKLTVTSVISQQKGESQVIEASGGAMTSEYEVTIDDYDANKHFFLSEYFRDNYNKALSTLPAITSNITITNIEVWVTNKSTNFEESRNILAVNDLGEDNAKSQEFKQEGRGRNPDNEVNAVYTTLSSDAYSGIRDVKDLTQTLEGTTLVLGKDYEKIENARLLSEREYDYHPKLGYISLNSSLNNDEVLAVAYEYNINGETFKVGEISTSSGVNAPQTLILKLLKGTNFTPNSYTWNLMMKNIYAIGAYQVQEDDFTLDVLYRDDKTGNNINYIPEDSLNKSTLIRHLHLDNMNSQRDPYPDGVFDYLSGVTILPQNGRIIFPVLEPFGEDLRKVIENSDAPNADKIIEKYVFQELYDSTQTKARQIAEKNKFLIAGTYASSSSSEINLNAMNVPEGSVKVIAGGRELIEGQDYRVDYTLGRVSITNDAILQSGTPIKVSLESQSLFAMQTKTMLGSHLDYKISDNFNVGGTILRLTEKPMTQKVNFGDEPISNTIWGLNTNYSSKVPLITTLVDKLPFIETKAPSEVSFTGEFAHLIPGHSKAISEEGNSYIDDFEGSETSIDMKYYTAWHLASTPKGYNFEGADLNNNLEYGYGRAKLAWYQIDRLFLENKSYTPQHIKDNPNLKSNPYVYQVYEQDIFPNKDLENNFPTPMSVLNLSYYPRERGPYNFDHENIDFDGNLNNPEERWGGIMRDVYSSDFEASNVEFIEFWLMDPYAGMEGQNGGVLYFNLGNVSEDILKDSRKTFENGLPTTAVIEKVDTSAWGRVPVVQSLVTGFEGGDATRKYQDIGLDGLNNKDEREFFAKGDDSFLSNINNLLSSGSISQDAYNKIMDDPSSDDFHYFRGSDYDADEVGILDRYKDYNNPQGNSPSDADNDESYPTSGTTLPDIEDINRDHTLSENESFYSYRVELSPSELEVGRNNIVDKVVHNVTYANDETDQVTWYQFRIPIYDYDNVVGDISDFKSIRFMRMFLTGFQDTVFLRFAKLELIRGEWRRYNQPFFQGGENWTGIEPPAGELAISAVNIEENAGKEPVNYTLPPGFTRQTDPSQPQYRQLNEQSIVLKALELGDGDARAAYKNLEMDMRQYKKIQMEAHAEALIGDELMDDELAAFIRLGTDYQGNYYEYEVPLKLTPHGKYENTSQADREIVWPDENRFEILLSDLTDLKLERNRKMNDPSSNVDYTTVYYNYDDRGNKISVCGSPNLSSIRTIMIGVRNPKQGANSYIDDGLAKSGEIWLNELRLTDFDESGGWAATGRATARLADLGTVAVAGSNSTAGFGSLEQSVNERSQEQAMQYDLSTNLELGKFFNEESGVSIPMYFGYSQSRITPEYDPTNPDVLYEESLANEQIDSLRMKKERESLDQVTRKSFALTNVRMNPKKKDSKQKIYSISNWSGSFALNEMESFSPQIEQYDTRNVKGNIIYNYSTRPKNVQPFKNSKVLNGKWFRPVKDFNFYYLPSRISLKSDMDRSFLEKKIRNINNSDFVIEPTYKKDFYWNTDFTLKYDFTKNLKFDLQASNIARLDSEEDYFGEDRYFEDFKKDIWDENIRKSVVRTTNYYHQFNLSYTLPINKIPLLDWMTVNTKYKGTYNWDVGPELYHSDTLDEGGNKIPIELGNSISNSNTIQANAQLNFVNLYNKVDYLKSINDKYRSRGRGRANQNSKESEQRTKTKIYEKDNIYFKEGSSRYVTHNLKTEKLQVEVLGPDGGAVEHSLEVISDKRVKITADSTVRNGRIKITGTILKGEDPVTFIVENSVRMLMAVRTFNVNYSQSTGTYLPGYMPEASLFTLGTGSGSGYPGAPGLNYLAGFNDPAFPQNAYNNSWLTNDTLFNESYNSNISRRLTYRATIEPIKGLKIDLNGNMQYSQNSSEFYIEDGFGNLPSTQGERGWVENGSFNMSFLSIRTAFEPITQTIDSVTNVDSDAFNNLKDEYRRTISERLSVEHNNALAANSELDPTDPYYRSDPFPEDTIPELQGYYTKYGPSSQQVLIPAFLSAYGYRDVNEVSITGLSNLWKVIPMPNWKVNYDGLGKIEALKEYVNSITLSHAYRSTLSMGSFVNNTEYIGIASLESGQEIPLNVMNDFVVQHTANSITIREQFSPLIMLSMDWKNSFTTRFEIKRTRDVSLNMANTQVNEVGSESYVFGLGYRFNEVPLILNGNEITSDLNVRVDFSYKNAVTVIRKLDDIAGNSITAGQKILTVKATADYQLSEKFTVRAFYDQRVNKPHISTTYDNANYQVGFSLTFSL